MITPLLLMPLPVTILIIVLVVLLAAFIAIAIWGSKQQKKAEASQQQMEAAAQPMTMLIIDKKRLKMKESGLPKVVIESTPKYLRRSKIPVVKAKVGPRIMTLMCDDTAFEMLPVKQEVRAMVSGIYIMSVRSLRGPALTMPPKKKQGLLARLRSKAAAAAGKK